MLRDRLIPLLSFAGHQVWVLAESDEEAEDLRDQGADPIVTDPYNIEAATAALRQTRPQVVVHEMTEARSSLAESLLATAHTVGVICFIAQRFDGWNTVRQGIGTIRPLEQMVIGAAGLTGIVLRYGTLYGPSTNFGRGGETLEMLRGRRLPLVGEGTGIWSFVHADDAANATRLAIERGPAGRFDIVDDEPVQARVWLPYLANVIGAPAPRRIPAWMSRFAAHGDPRLSLPITGARASSAPAKRVLRWRPRYNSWREGFREGL